VFYHFIELNGRTVMGMGYSKKKAKAQTSRIMPSFIEGAGRPDSGNDLKGA